MIHAGFSFFVFYVVTIENNSTFLNKQLLKNAVLKFKFTTFQNIPERIFILKFTEFADILFHGVCR